MAGAEGRDRREGAAESGDTPAAAGAGVATASILLQGNDLSGLGANDAAVIDSLLGQGALDAV